MRFPLLQIRGNLGVAAKVVDILEFTPRRLYWFTQYVEALQCFIEALLEWLAPFIGDDQELSAIRALTEEWLERKYPGLTAEQRLAMTRAIFEEAITDMRRAIPDIVEGVLERYGLVSPSHRAKPIAAAVKIAGR